MHKNNEEIIEISGILGTFLSLIVNLGETELMMESTEKEFSVRQHVRRAAIIR